jgi:hypothetical protein
MQKSKHIFKKLSQIKFIQRPFSKTLNEELTNFTAAKWGMK